MLRGISSNLTKKPLLYFDKKEGFLSFRYFLSVKPCAKRAGFLCLSSFYYGSRLLPGYLESNKGCDAGHCNFRNWHFSPGVLLGRKILF